jgi:hypothetical protein
MLSLLAQLSALFGTHLTDVRNARIDQIISPPMPVEHFLQSDVSDASQA